MQPTTAFTHRNKGRIRRWLVLFTLSFLLVGLESAVEAQGRFRRNPGLQQEGPPGLSHQEFQFIREHFPDRFSRLERLRAADPETFREKARELHTEVRRLMAMREEDPARFQVQIDEIALRSTVRRLGERVRDSQGVERQEAETELRQALTRAFDLRQQLKQAEFEGLKKELDELENSLQLRLERREELIEEKFQELTTRPEVDW